MSKCSSEKLLSILGSALANGDQLGQAERPETLAPKGRLDALGGRRGAEVDGEGAVVV